MPPGKSEDERNALGKLESKTMLRSGAPNSTSSTDILFGPADLLVQVEAKEEADQFQHRQIAVKEEDQASPNCSPLLPDEVDVTVPLLVNALVRNLHIQSTPMPTKNRPSIPVSEDATPNFPSSKIQPIVPEGVEQLSASALAAISKRGLCPTGEVCVEKFVSQIGDFYHYLKKITSCFRLVIFIIILLFFHFRFRRNIFHLPEAAPERPDWLVI